MIGIRLADGSFYAILDETQKHRKRMMLSPANDNQQSVHIQFYRSSDESFEEHQFLGSVDLEGLAPSSKEEASISIVLGMNENNDLDVVVRDELGGLERQLILNTEGVEQSSENLFTDGDFSLDEEFDLPEPAEFIGDREDMDELHRQAALHDGELVSDYERPQWDDSSDRSFSDSEREGLKPAVLIAFVILAVSATVGLSFLIFHLMRSSDVPPIHSMVFRVLQTARNVIGAFASQIS